MVVVLLVVSFGVGGSLHWLVGFWCWELWFWFWCLILVGGFVLVAGAGLVG